MIDNLYVKKVNLKEKFRERNVKKLATVLLNSLVKVEHTKIGIFVKNLKEPHESEMINLSNDYRFELLSKDRKKYYDNYKEFNMQENKFFSEKDLLENGTCILVFHKDAVIGYIWVVAGKVPYLELFDMRMDISPIASYIFHFFVKKEFRKKGLGYILEKKAIETFQDKKEYMWSVIDDSNSPSLKIAKKLGFRLYASGTKWEWFLFKRHQFRTYQPRIGAGLRIMSFNRNEIIL